MSGPKIQLTKKYQVLPSMPHEQFEALKADIAELGVLVPIAIDEDGHILDGHHRYRACTELGITDFPTIVCPGMSEEEGRMFARKMNMLRRHLNREQVRQLIANQLKETPDWANNRIGQQLGVDSKTVKAVREKLVSTSEIPKFDKLIGADGKERPSKQTSIIVETVEAELDDAETKLDGVIEQPSSPATNMDKKSKRRSAEEIKIERFLEGVSILANSCGFPLELGMPSLDKEQIQRAVKDVSRAERSLRKFRIKLEQMQP